MGGLVLIDVQLYLAIGVPMAFNAILFTVFTQMIDKRMDNRFASMNQRFDDMRDLWRAELHRVEEVLDARLKHIEEER
jgi:hypothetical protein